MIGSLRGTVIDRDIVLDKAAAGDLTIEVAGVGYLVTVTAATLSRLPADETVLLFIHHHIREADQKLFGFLDKDERRAFEGLLSAHGVGPSLALAVLATHPVDQLARILADDDLTALCEVPGVGKKTAQRLLVELKSSLVLAVIDEPGVSAGTNGAGALAVGSTTHPLADVREALVNLGYSSEEIRRAVASLGDTNSAEFEDADDSGQLLKRALLNLANG